MAHGSGFDQRQYFDEQQNPTVTSLADGGFVYVDVVKSNGSDWGVYGQRFRIDQLKRRQYDWLSTRR